jgi:hypothetical protein
MTYTKFGSRLADFEFSLIHLCLTFTLFFLNSLSISVGALSSPRLETRAQQTCSSYSQDVFGVILELATIRQLNAYEYGDF